MPVITVSLAPPGAEHRFLDHCSHPGKAVLRQPPTAPSHCTGECKNMPTFNSKLSSNFQSLGFISAGEAYSSPSSTLYSSPTQMPGSASCQCPGPLQLAAVASGLPLGAMPPAPTPTPQLCFTSSPIPISQDWEAENLYSIRKGFCSVVVLKLRASYKLEKEGLFFFSFLNLSHRDWQSPSPQRAL